jgi:hypothetical protein
MKTRRKVIIHCEGIGFKGKDFELRKEITHESIKDDLLISSINYGSKSSIVDFFNLRHDVVILDMYDNLEPLEDKYKVASREDIVEKIINKLVEHREADEIFLMGGSHGSILMQIALLRCSETNTMMSVLEKTVLINLGSPRYPGENIIKRIWCNDTSSYNSLKMYVYNYYSIYDKICNKWYYEMLLNLLPGENSPLRPRSKRVYPLTLSNTKFCIQRMLFQNYRSDDIIYHCHPFIIFAGGSHVPFGEQYYHDDWYCSKLTEFFTEFAKELVRKNT